MAESEYRDVRVKESLRVKIAEAKNLPATSFSGSARNTCCAIKIDSEEIFRTNTVERSTDPFFAAEFQGEIPKKFRYLSFYVFEVGNKNKVLGKVSLKKEELYKYHQKEHWFPLTYQDGDTEVQGKVHVEIRVDEILTPAPDTSRRMSVRLIECSDLTVISGSCNPYGVVALSYGRSRTREEKKTAVKKKTICPQFGETFCFSIDSKGQNQEKSSYAFDDFMTGELSISLYHDDSKVSREVLGNIFKGAFLGEVKISIRDIDFSRPHKAWYCLQAKEHNRTNDQSLGSIRLKISYTADYVFPSKFYDGLRQLILKSVDTKPFTASTVFIIGEIVNHRESAARENAAQPLVKLFLHHGKLVPLINALACWEMSTTTDPNTLFRGNSLLTKMVDELMKMIGLPYLHDTLKSFVHQVIYEPRPCEIDPCRMRDGENLDTNLSNLYEYVNEALNIIVGSSLVCPPILRDVFCMLKSQAIVKYRNDAAVRYHAVTSFIFLRFFTAAITGPNLFDLYSDTLEPQVQRTFTLISKGVTGLVSLVCSKSNSIAAKEEYMVPLFERFPQLVQAEIKMFLDIISSSTGSHVKVIEAPIVLKEGYLIKRAQGRKRFGIINFRKRFFRLTNQSLSYSKNKGDRHVLFEIPITDILVVEKLEEESFKMKYMLQVVHAQRALYIQASNCVEEKEWLDILTKICKSNQNRLTLYHPAAFINNHWLCCKVTDVTSMGCKPVTGGMPVDDILGEIDSDQEVEKIHSLLLSAMDLLDDLLGYVDADEVVCDETCGSMAVYSGNTDKPSTGLGSGIEDPSVCFTAITELQSCIITLEQEHLQYMHFLQSRTVMGSVDTPFGDESNTDLVRNINRSSERLSRHGSRSSNASNISRQSFRRSRSRGGSFQERGSVVGHSVARKSVSVDVAALAQNMDSSSAGQVEVKSSQGDVSDGGRARAASGDSGRGTDCSIVDISCCLGNSSSLTDSGIRMTGDASYTDASYTDASYTDALPISSNGRLPSVGDGWPTSLGDSWPRSGADGMSTSTGGGRPIPGKDISTRNINNVSQYTSTPELQTDGKPQAAASGRHHFASDSLLSDCTFMNPESNIDTSKKHSDYYFTNAESDIDTSKKHNGHCFMTAESDIDTSKYHNDNHSGNLSLQPERQRQPSSGESSGAPGICSNSSHPIPETTCVDKRTSLNSPAYESSPFHLPGSFQKSDLPHSTKSRTENGIARCSADSQSFVISKREIQHMLANRSSMVAVQSVDTLEEQNNSQENSQCCSSRCASNDQDLLLVSNGNCLSSAGHPCDYVVDIPSGSMINARCETFMEANMHPATDVNVSQEKSVHVHVGNKPECDSHSVPNISRIIQPEADLSVCGINFPPGSCTTDVCDTELKTPIITDRVESKELIPSSSHVTGIHTSGETDLSQNVKHLTIVYI